MKALDVFKVLADETRLRSVLLIQREGELCVCELVEALAETQPKISRHLAQLRKAGVLADRRQGQWVFYRLHGELPDWVRQMLQQVGAQEQAGLRQALARLEGMLSRPAAGGNACGVNC
ncbi:metalloregulator ArsR/SmtB family transcription factor [Marinobacterium marinum]|uniref:Metalloregulator ArsR/SmtB family transcription factor n=1 Tax=Marinobacterium marinum TaxID=2756129 RepID=A0A7W1WY98_9GAMM|nr:metalloregulator ArsR/SmtB family transcription factor [Marinobacterium marinum]MBA4502358.1 metalloregulator ArsR/SmtB family transcription factor [Marinobacterium marinum]